MKSVAWNNEDYPITQGFGPDGGFNPLWYDYAKNYGWPAGTHIGLDVGVPKYHRINAVQPGTVIRAGWDDSFRPNPVWVKEDDGDIAIYGHLWDANVAVGQRVVSGQKVGISGEQTIKGTMTPDGSGPHIHYELRRPIGNQADGQGLSGYVAVDPAYELTTAKSSGGIPTTTGGNLYGNQLMNSDDIKKLGIRVLLVIAGLAVMVPAIQGLK